MFRALVAALATIWLAVTLAFFALRVLPGDAIEIQLRESGAGTATIEARRQAAGLDQPVARQYLTFMANLLRGNLGISLLDGRAVTDIIAGQLAPTVELTAAALVTAVGFGLLLGCLAGLETGGGISALARLIIALSLSMPIYWTGTIAIFVFTAQLGLLPSAGAGRVNQLILPALVLGFHSAGAIGQIVHANVREIRSADFVRTARAKGLAERTVVIRHILRASLLPAITIIAVQAGFLLSGVVITEMLFNRPGVGRLLLDATLRQNYPVVQGIVIWSAVAYTLVNLAADLVTRVLDPRVQSQLS